MRRLLSRRHIPLFGLALAIAFLATTSGSAAPVNYITNGTFEVNSTGWSLVNGSSGSVARANTLGGANSTSYSLYANSGTSRRVNVTHTATYAFTYNGGATSASLNHYYRKSSTTTGINANTITIYLSGPNDGGAYGATQQVWTHTGTGTVAWTNVATNVLARLQAGGNGSWNLRATYIQNNDDSAGLVGSAVDEVQLNIDVPSDTTPPTNPTLSSPSHTVSADSNDNTVQINWSGASDNDSGVDGFSYLFDTTAVTTPDTTKDQEETGTTTTSGALSDGTSHYFHLRTVDNAGNWSGPVHMGPFFIDTLAPTTTFATTPDASPTGSNGWYKTPESITLTRNDAGSTGYKWNAGGTWTAYSGSFAALEGSNTLYYQSTDDASNVETMKTQGVSIDTVAPTNATVNSSHTESATSNDNTIQWDWSGASDATSAVDGFSYVWDNSATTTPDTTKEVEEGATTVTSSALTDDVWYFHFRTIDNAGNPSSVVHKGPYTIDTLAPTTTFATTPDANPTGSNGWYNTPESVTLTRNQAGTTGYKWNAGGAWTAYSESFALIEGSNTLYFQSTDDAGNVETMKTQGVSLDTVAPGNPTVSSSHTEGASSNDNTIDVTWPTGGGGSASDGTSGVDGFSYVWDNSASTTPDSTKDIEESVGSLNSGAKADGVWYFHIRTLDNAGNQAATVVHKGPYTIDTDPPAVSSRTPANGATEVSTGTNVTATFDEDMSADTITTSNFTLKSSTNDPVAGTVSYNAGTRVATFTPSSALLQSETYTATVTTAAKDSAGNGLPANDSWSFTTSAGPDTTPPTTTAQITPDAAPTGINGWYNTSESVILTRSEAGSTGYKWNAGGAWTAYSTSLAVLQGQNTLYYQSTDDAGNVETMKTLGVSLDTVAPDNPTVSSSHTAGQKSNDNTIQFTWPTSGGGSASDGTSGVDGFSYLWDNSAGTTPDATKDAEETTGSATTSALTDDVWYFHLRTLDSAGNQAASVVHMGPYTIDTLVPTTTLVVTPDASPTGSNGWYKTAESIVLSRSENGTTGYKWNAGGTWTNYSSSLSMPEGQNVLYYQSTDDAANVETTKTQGVSLDTVAPSNPTGSSSHTEGGSSSDDTVAMSWPTSGGGSATDATSGVDGFSWEWTTSATTTPDTTKEAEETSGSTTSSPLGDGSWYFHLRTIDNAGNGATVVHKGPFNIDVTAPATTPSPSPANPDGLSSWYTSQPTISLSAPGSSSIEYKWDSTADPWTTYSSSFTASQGNHTLYYRARDAIGNVETIQSQQFKVDVASLGGTPTDPTSTSSSSHTVNEPSSDPTISISWSGAADGVSGVGGYSVEWSQEATTLPDNVLDLTAGQTSTVSPTLSTGNWYFHLRTMDIAGNWTSTVHEGPFPINGPDIGAGPHGGFSASTNKCKNCHRPHQAPGYRLIFAREGSYSTIAGFCFTCHKDGAGANNDVYNGIFRGTAYGTQDASGVPLHDIENTSTYGAPGAGLNGGGFVYARPYTGVGNRQGATADVTSRHDVVGVPGVTQDSVTMWGSTSTGPGSTVSLWCVSCHIPHGSSNYRLLRDKLTPSGGQAFPKDTVKSHEIAFDTSPSTGNLDRSYTTVSYWKGITRFCTSCHLQYSSPKGRTDDASGTYNSGDGMGSIVRYRHPVDVPLSNWTWPGYNNWGDPNGNIATNLNDPDHTMLPLEQESYGTTADAGNKVVCLTCHQVHGSSAATVTLDSRAGPTTTAISSGPGYSNLLRLNYRGVCENCHDWWQSPTNSNGE